MAGRGYLTAQDTPLITVQDDLDCNSSFSTTYKFGNTDGSEQQWNGLQRILEQQNQVKNESVASIQRSKALLFESEEIGIKTAQVNKKNILLC